VTINTGSHVIPLAASSRASSPSTRRHPGVLASGDDLCPTAQVEHAASQALLRIGESSMSAWGDLRCKEAAVLRAAIALADGDGIVDRTLAEWSKASQLNPRTVRRTLTSLCRRGALELLEQSNGGRGRGNRFRISRLGNAGATVQPEKPCRSNLETRTTRTLKPDEKTPLPGHYAPIQTQIIPNQQQQCTVVDVFSRFGIESLRGHRNATPKLMAYVASKAPSKKNPSGWAADYIRKGYEVPESFVKEHENDRRKRWLNELGMHKSRQAALVQEFHAEQRAGRVRRETSFGDWAWDKYGRAECTLLRQESA
jgi:hypothetical protein